MPVDPDFEDFDELMNPVDYFNIYKREMEKLAYQKFDLDQDRVFYSYLDKLTNKEQFKKNSKVDGVKMLREFIIDPSSLSSTKKRNEQQKKWQFYLQERLVAGLPAYAEQMDPKLVEKLYKFKDIKLERPLVTKEFYPELE